jgi:hypothetical protein
LFRNFDWIKYVFIAVVAMCHSQIGDVQSSEACFEQISVLLREIEVTNPDLIESIQRLRIIIEKKRDEVRGWQVERKRASMTIIRACTDCLYRPGGVGYLAARDRFQSACDHQIKNLKLD